MYCKNLLLSNREVIGHLIASDLEIQYDEALNVFGNATALAYDGMIDDTPHFIKTDLYVAVVGLAWCWHHVVQVKSRLTLVFVDGWDGKLQSLWLAGPVANPAH